MVKLQSIKVLSQMCEFIQLATSTVSPPWFFHLEVMKEEFRIQLWGKAAWILRSLPNPRVLWSHKNAACSQIFAVTSLYTTLTFSWGEKKFYQRLQFSSVSRVQLFATPWITALQASLSITNSRSWLKLTSIESVMPSNHLILCRPLLLLLPIPHSIRVFSSESTLHVRWSKYWRFSFNISPSNEHPGLISFRMDWLALLAVQGTLKSILQHHSSKASILRPSAFFTVQLSHPYMTTRKTIALTRWTLVGKVMSRFSICYLGWS